mmetsp:Transcript_985/g.2108  ORF Transcript_985/g.2108 Transcript_985/m.2108 type:complete len:423 (+) Transcript_985:1394-2662(+)
MYPIIQTYLGKVINETEGLPLSDVVAIFVERLQFRYLKGAFTSQTTAFFRVEAKVCGRSQEGRSMDGFVVASWIRFGSKRCHERGICDRKPSRKSLRMNGEGLGRREFLVRLGVLAGGGAGSLAACPGLAVEDAPRMSTGVIFDTNVGSYLPARIADLLHHRFAMHMWDRRVVAFGEVHTCEPHHRAQLEMIKALYEFPDRQPLSIGLEHFFRQDQDLLDAFNAGDVSSEELRILSKWDTNFGFDYHLWKPIFDFAQQARVPLVGLNAPPEVVRWVAKHGLDELPHRISEDLPDIDLGDKYHRANFERMMGQMAMYHGFPDDKAMSRYYEVYTLWEEYMSETAARYLAKHPTERMIVLAGEGHVRGRRGLPERIRRRIGSQPFTVVPQMIAWLPENLPDVVYPPDWKEADWVWFIRDESSRD